ncbi:Zn-ribbon domain-containing OB-fold protein [Haloferacaceae archaeon DSL9]
MTDDSPDSNCGYRCLDCDARWYYTRPRCPDCGADATETYCLGVGTVLAKTTTHVTPADVRSPNHLGLVAFDDGVRLVAQLDEGVSVNDRVAFAGDHILREADRRPVRGPRLVSETEAVAHINK